MKIEDANHISFDRGELIDIADAIDDIQQD